MFWFPLLPPIPLATKQLNSPMVVMAGFMLFQLATVMWLESQLVALYLQLAEHQAPLQRRGPILSTAGCYGSSTALWRTGRCWGDYSSFDRDVPVLSCKLIPHTISLGLSGHISSALWKPQGLWLLLHVRVRRKKRFCTSGSISLWASLFYTLGGFVYSRTTFPYMFCYVFQQELRGGKGRWDGFPPAEPSWQTPKSSPGQQAGNPGVRPAHGQPCEAASAQTLQSSRRDQAHADAPSPCQGTFQSRDCNLERTKFAAS